MKRAVGVLLFVPFIVGTVLAFAAIIRRLLGVRVRPFRTLLAKIAALITTAPILAAIAPPTRHG